MNRIFGMILFFMGFGVAWEAVKLVIKASDLLRDVLFRKRRELKKDLFQASFLALILLIVAIFLMSFGITFD